LQSEKFTFKAVEFYEISAAEAEQRIDNFLISKAKNVPKSHLYRLIRKGEIRVNKKRIKPEYKLMAGDVLRLPPIKDATKLCMPMVQSAFKPQVVFENDAFLVINKPSGLAVHGGSGLSGGAIETLRVQFPNLTQLELAHRLDRETSGVLVCAKTKKALRSIHQCLRDKQVNKRYLALLSGAWKSHKKSRVVEVALRKNQNIAGERLVRVHPEGDAAKTTFRLLANFQDCCLVEASPETGRTHQIRVHAKHIEHAIVGDDKYGDKQLNKKFKSLGLNRLFLHARSLSFYDGTKHHHFEAELPKELTSILDKLGCNNDSL
jgi:23S rRNA pseudouridine955/2504/2580 synthase